MKELEFDFEIPEEIKKSDPLLAKYYKLFLLMQKQQAEILIRLINKYDEERQVRLMQLISSTAEELSKAKQTSLKAQWEEAKEIVKEIMSMFMQPQQLQPIQPVSPVSPVSPKPKLEVKTEDINI